MSSEAHILLVEDDKNFGMILHDYLRINGFRVTLKQDGEEGLSTLKKETFDLCIFDVMMPKKDGFTLAAEYKEISNASPFIFLTAKAIKDDVLTGYKLGADDYIIKPFDSEVLLMKINAILKRKAAAPVPEEMIVIGNSMLNRPMRTLTVSGKSIRLSPKECELLLMLCEYRNNIMPRTKALNQIWKEDNYFTARSMDVYITKLRKYLQDDAAVSINNLHGSGYSLLVKKVG
jgi:two-component system, OmpR family, response regulator